MSQICETFTIRQASTHSQVTRFFFTIFYCSESKSKRISVFEYVYNIMSLELYTSRNISDLLKRYLKILTHLTKDSHSLALSRFAVKRRKMWLSRYEARWIRVNAVDKSRKYISRVWKFQKIADFKINPEIAI